VDQGGFAAVDMAINEPRAFTVGPPPRGTLDAILAAVEMPLFAIIYGASPPAP
jgi:hypothetical protein